MVLHSLYRHCMILTLSLVFETNMQYFFSELYGGRHFGIRLTRIVFHLINSIFSSITVVSILNIWIQPNGFTYMIQTPCDHYTTCGCSFFKLISNNFFRNFMGADILQRFHKNWIYVIQHFIRPIQPSECWIFCYRWQSSRPQTG